jgi:hypothetical protein
MSLLSTVANRESENPAEIIGETLRAMEPTERLDALIDLFNSANVMDERVAHSVAAAWAYLVDHSVWASRFPRLDIFEQYINFTDAIEPFIDKDEQLTRRTITICDKIQSSWGMDPRTDFPVDINPRHISQRLARELQRLSTVCLYEDALPLLRSEIANRLSILQRSKEPYLQAIDVSNVIQSVVESSPPPSSKRHKHAPPPRIRDDTPEYTAGIIINATEHTSQPPPPPPPPPSPPSPPPEPKPCSCPEDMLQVLQSLKGPRASEEGSTFFVTVMESGILRDICHRHLRSLCSQAVGLQSNNSHAVLLKRLEETYPHVNNLDPFTIDHPDWFYKDVRVITEEESRLRVFKFPGEPHDDMVVDDAISEIILTRYGGPDTVNVWYDVGTIIVGDVFQYINTLELNALVDIEFNIYRHHHRMLPGKKRLGWLRNMFFSIIQQLVRQDLVWYALSVACRPDHNHRLITYPYVTKDTDPGKRTYFFHMDLNVERYCKDGHGGNLLTSSVSLDDEDEQSCTFIMPGFHKHIHDWHRKRTAAGTSTNGYTTGLANAFTAEELKEWPLQPCPCPAYGIRISNAQTPHGSHGPTELPADSTEEPTDHRRRTCSAWHSAFDKEHQKLDIDDTLSHPDLTRCHLYLEVPSREPSGQTPKYGAPDYRFPASVVLGSISPIGDALVGRRKYTDPEVQRDLKILFGSDREAAAKLVKQHQDEAVRQYFVAYKKMEALEREIFGENSYFHWRDQGNLGIPEAE